MVIIIKTMAYSTDDTKTNKYGAVVGTRIGQENRSLRKKKPAPLINFEPRIQYDLTWDRNWPGPLWEVSD
jgi:hypothetical protein